MSSNPFNIGGGSGVDGPGGVYASITPGAGNLTDDQTGQEYVARCLVCGVGGLATLVDAEGNTRTNFPLQKGYNPIGAQKVTSFSGSNLWGIKG